ncbi:MAG: hypothetical protein JWO37_503 [Acidimicrobiales bacterium]|nr:hypothetical protein [Acidimicrobiales bacterium]
MSRPRRREESGFTLVEIMVVALIMGVIGAALFGLLASMTGNERAQEARADNGQSVRFALADIVRDIRGADPVSAPPDTATAASILELTLLPATADGAGQHVRWQLAGDQLLRAVLDGPGGAAVTTRIVLTGVHNAADGVPLLRYLGATGAELPAGVTPADVVNCTRSVRVTIVAGPERASVASESADAIVRNHQSGGIGC